MPHRPTLDNIYRAAISALDESLQKNGKVGPKTGFLRTLEILNYNPKLCSKNEQYVQKAFDYVLDHCSDDGTWANFKSRISELNNADIQK